MTPSITTATATPSVGRRPDTLKRITYKLVGVGVRGFSAGQHLAYRLGRLGSGAITHVDHITVPCTDLRVAEEFYVGLLRARVAMRLDEARLQRLGWSLRDIRDNHAAHLSLTFGAGPRLDLFEYPTGVPGADAPLHPHVALGVGPRTYLDWKRRLLEHGVPVAGPTRPGPPGQASLYFNDPFGNHLELVAVGFTDEVLTLGVPTVSQRTALGYTWTSHRFAGVHGGR
jgi:catechol 2,3-dioxygenase-like lactoylglutathione lyase family enzyme